MRRQQRAIEAGTDSAEVLVVPLANIKRERPEREVGFKCTPTVHEQLKAAAAIEGKKLAAFLRDATLDRARAVIRDYQRRVGAQA